MTRSHAKNAHSSPVFTYHERSQLPYGSKKLRLGAESFRAFDCCMLCNSAVRSPVACPDGHLYCRECILESLLSQKKLIKAHQVALKRRAAEEEEERAKARLAARERVMKDFEKNQVGLGVSSNGAVGGSKDAKAQSQLTSTIDQDGRGTKRKFDFDVEAVGRLATAAEDAALAVLAKEHADSRVAKLPAFWLPSLAPQADGPTPLADIKLETMCTASKHPHPLALKNLITVNFTPLARSSTSITPAPPSKSICSCCSKELSNATTSVLIKGCGHVVCSPCVDKVIKKGKQCVSCEGSAKEKELIELKRDGTGFAAAGNAESVKAGTAFQ